MNYISVISFIQFILYGTYLFVIYICFCGVTETLMKLVWEDAKKLWKQSLSFFKLSLVFLLKLKLHYIMNLVSVDLHLISNCLIFNPAHLCSLIKIQSWKYLLLPHNVSFFAGISHELHPVPIRGNGSAVVSRRAAELFQVCLPCDQWISQGLTSDIQIHVGQQIWTSPWLPTLGWLHCGEKFVSGYRGW